MADCPTISDVASDDTAECGKTYTKEYGLTQWTWVPPLTPPLTWSIGTGPGGSLSDENLWEATGTLTYDIPANTPNGTIFTWQINMVDSEGCSYSVTWQTEVACCDCDPTIPCEDPEEEYSFLPLMKPVVPPKKIHI